VPLPCARCTTVGAPLSPLLSCSLLDAGGCIRRHAYSVGVSGAAGVGWAGDLLDARGVGWGQVGRVGWGGGGDSGKGHVGCRTASTANTG
jgi:hypothetical protein